MKARSAPTAFLDLVHRFGFNDPRYNPTEPEIMKHMGERRAFHCNLLVAAPLF